jgi:hypothetical protein
MRLRRDPVPIRSIRPGVPRALDDLILTTLARQPERRPASAAVFRDALLRVNAVAADDATGVASAVTRPAASVVPAPNRPDRTPSSGIARPQPNERRWVVPAVTIVLIALGLGVAGVLAGTTETGSRFIRAVRESVTGDDTNNEAAADEPTEEVAVTGDSGAAASIEGNGIYDPPPGDRAEHTGETGFLFDNDPATVWTTERYNNRGMVTGNGDKPGVGIVLRLDAPADGHELVVTSPTRGWSVQAFVSDAAHEDLALWGPPVAEANAITQDETTLTLTGGDNDLFVLLLVTDLGDGTTNERPFQVAIGSLAVR